MASAHISLFECAHASAPQQLCQVIQKVVDEPVPERKQYQKRDNKKQGKGGGKGKGRGASSSSRLRCVTCSGQAVARVKGARDVAVARDAVCSASPLI